MEQIVVTRPNGTTYPLAIRHEAVKITSATQKIELLGADTVQVSIESPVTQNYGLGDSITIFGRIYKLNRLPKVTKTGTRAFRYDLEFEGIQYDLLRATYDLTIDTTSNQMQDVSGESLTGNLERFATVLVANANRVFPNKWVLGTFIETEEDKTLTFGESDNCLLVLQNLCKEFEVEFEIVQSNGIFTINFVEKTGQTFPYTFQFGRGRGLYELNRQNVDSSNIITRLKVFGSTENITNKYRRTDDYIGSNRLCLPASLHGYKKADSYIEDADAIAKYGIFEACKYFDDIKPTRTGVITALGDSVIRFVDTDMFDLNERDENGTKYLLPGVSAKIHFNTGNLAGYEFDVHAFDNETNTFTIVPFEDERGQKFPDSNSPAFQFAVGDKYKLLEIALPDSYITDAETRLLEAATTYYEQNSQPKVQYGLSVSKDFIRKLFAGTGTTQNIFSVGDYIPVKDDDIGVDKSVRIKSFTRNLLDEYEYNLTISDTVTTAIINRVISELIEQDKINTINDLKNPARARANWRTSQELQNMVFDPDGYFTDKIRPEYIETIALLVGAKSMQFGLSGTSIAPNYNDDKNVVGVTGGILTNYSIDANSARTWTLADNTTTIGGSEPYYVYAKCQRTGDGGSVIFSTEKITTEQAPDFYHFWIGVISSVDAELQTRTFTPAYGFTSINGRFIKTGRIESSGGSDSYFDLDDGTFNLGDEASGLDFGATEAGKLTVRGLIKALGAVLGGFSIDNEKLKSVATAADGTTPLIELNGTDGSGHLAGGNVMWDALANLIITGKFESNADGNRIVIDPDTRSLKMIDSSNVLRLEFAFVNGYPYISLYGTNNRKTFISAGQLIITTGSGNGIGDELSIYFRSDGKIGFKFADNVIPSGRLQTGVGEMYLSGESLNVRLN